MTENSPPATPFEALRVSSSLEAIAPVLVFVVLNRLAGLRWAVLGATLWSLKVIIARIRSGTPLGRFMPVITIAVIGRGVIGIATDSEALYFGLGIATKYLIAAALLVSVLARTPLAGVAARTLFVLQDSTTSDSRFRSAMAIVTTIAAAYYIVSASFDIWLYRRSSVDGYVIIRFLVNWPMSTAAAIGAIAVLRRQLREVPGLSGLSDILGLPPASPMP